MRRPPFLPIKQQAGTDLILLSLLYTRPASLVVFLSRGRSFPFSASFFSSFPPPSACPVGSRARVHSRLALPSELMAATALKFSSSRSRSRLLSPLSSDTSLLCIPCLTFHHRFPPFLTPRSGQPRQPPFPSPNTSTGSLHTANRDGPGVVRFPIVYLRLGRFQVFPPIREPSPLPFIFLRLENLWLFSFHPAGWMSHQALPL